MLNLMNLLIKLKFGQVKKILQIYIQKKIFIKQLKKQKKKLLKVKLEYEGPIEAPIKKDQVIGSLKIIYDDELVDQYELLTLKEVKKVNIFSRLIRSLNYLIWGDV